ncbi:MAG: glycerophosphodiester phosphodiesterase family protein [Clostridia bacterium]|nr:glycerophosphodiester phosphodiesterase family protein [Clostridia bacterium]
MDFAKSIFENAGRMPLVCAHRGSSAGNIPCNTLAAFNAALLQGADMIELDVAISADGKHYVFHPGMEQAYLKTQSPIRTLPSEEVDRLSFYNSDDTKTQFGVVPLAEAFAFLRGKCYINVDKFWTDVPGISRVIRACGVENQVVVKTGTDAQELELVRQYASDFMFMPIVRGRDDVTDRLVSDGVRCIGAEVLFETLDEPCCSPAYITQMHEKGRVLFVNAEVYDHTAVISAGLTDDVSVAQSPESGWGKLADMGFDIIQTDWSGLLKNYLRSRSKAESVGR